MVTATREDEKALQPTMKRIDRLMKAVQLEVKDSDFRFELVADLVAIRRKVTERCEGARE